MKCSSRTRQLFEPYLIRSIVRPAYINRSHSLDHFLKLSFLTAPDGHPIQSLVNMCHTLFALLATLATAFAQDPCQVACKQCISSGQPEVKCSCGLTACLGEDAARIRERCASATANLTTSTTSSLASTTSQTIITGTPGSQPPGQPPITAAEALGETCSDDRQCANGVECWGSHAGIIRKCGNFNARCANDSQCAYNTCNNGLCNGFLPSSAH